MEYRSCAQCMFEAECETRANVGLMVESAVVTTPKEQFEADVYRVVGGACEMYVDKGDEKARADIERDSPKP